MYYSSGKKLWTRIHHQNERQSLSYLKKFAYISSSVIFLFKVDSLRTVGRKRSFFWQFYRTQKPNLSWYVLVQPCITSNPLLMLITIFLWPEEKRHENVVDLFQYCFVNFHDENNFHIGVIVLHLLLRKVFMQEARKFSKQTQNAIQDCFLYQKCPKFCNRNENPLQFGNGIV